ncbi:MAG: methanogenesis marker 3 protein [Methanomicrobiales archaeon]|nr:methanogenesis marker 3 protein [Methanomicrobiales archaeon]
MEIHLDGNRVSVPEGTLLRDLLPGWDACCAVAVVLPAEAKAMETLSLVITTTSGEIVVEGSSQARTILTGTGLAENLHIGWVDRYTAAFGPFRGSFIPARSPFRYERGDMIMGCGGYDPARSYLVFSKMRHTADHGAAEDGGVLGRVVSGLGVLDRWGPDDAITRIEPVVSWADTSRSFTTTDPSVPLVEGMQVVTFIAARAEGFTPGAINPVAAESVEHLLRILEKGRFHVQRTASTHIRDGSAIPTDVPIEMRRARREGTITMRGDGVSRGGIYIYCIDLPSSTAHTAVGQVLHGIEVVRLAKVGEILDIRITPPRCTFIGLTTGEAVAVATERKVAIEFDGTPSGYVVNQEPPTTLAVLAEGKALLTTVPEELVVGIILDDVHAPMTCRIFRAVTGLDRHAIGKMPLIFRFEDVALFRPPVPDGTRILPENIPDGEVPPFTLAMTNDSRRSVGIVGVRSTKSSEYGPTSEPFEGTNIIGTIVEREKLQGFRERERVYIREVAP